MIKETRQPFQSGAPSAWLAMRGILPGHAKLVRIRPGIAIHSNGMKALRRGGQGQFHHPVPFAGPAATCGKPAMHAKLQLFDNLDSGAARPGQYPPVTVIGPLVPGFLMHAYAGHPMRGAKAGEHFHRIADAQHKRLSKRGEVGIKL